MTFSKIPIPIKGKGKLTGYKQRLASKMEMDGENMLLMAEIEVLKKEKDAALRYLETAEMTISLLKSEILVMKETVKDQGMKHQADISKLRASRNKCFNFARKIENGTFDKAKKDAEERVTRAEESAENEILKIEGERIVMVEQVRKDAMAELEEITKQKDEEIKEWKAKYNEVNKILITHDAKINKLYPTLSEFQTSQLINHIYIDRSKVELAKLWSYEGQDIAEFKFRSQFSMSSLLRLNDAQITEIPNAKIRRTPLEPRCKSWHYIENHF